MDFQSLKRRDLQSLCKLNHIPANITNAAMIDALSSLDFVEGVEEFLGNPKSEHQGSPERSVITSPAQPPTTTHRKDLKDEVENSKLATRTRGGTKTKAKEGTDTRKTPATRTTRKRACQDASVKKEMEKDLQADFEADLDPSEVSVDSVHIGGELKDISEEVSGVSSDNGKLSENQSKPQSDLQQSNDEQDVNDADEVNVIDDQEESSEGKVDFHSLTRKDLQNLCKKNKIPANITNAAMADALASLETVEGLQEFLKDYNSEALKSPQASRVATSCAHRSRTTLKITKEEPQSLKLVTKSCCGSRKRILEEEEQIKNDVPETALCERESSQKKEESALFSCKLKQLGISSLDDKECPAVLSNGEDAENSEVSGLGELSSKTNNSKDDVLNVENLNEPEGLVMKVDENSIEESSKDAEVCIIVGESSRGGELENTRAQDSRIFEIDGASESDGASVKDLVSAPTLVVEDQISKKCNFESSTQAKQLLGSELKEHDNSEGSNSGDELSTHSMSAKSDIETNQADKLSLNSSGESESVDSCVEDDISDDSDAELESESSVTEEVMSGNSDIDTTTQGDKLLEINVESEVEDSRTEEESDSESILQKNQDTNVDIDSEEKQISMKTDIEITTEGDKLPEINAANELEGSYTKDQKFNPEMISQEDKANDVDVETTEADLCASSKMNQLEKVEITADSATYGQVVSNKIDIEKPEADLCAPTDQETPLKFKSLRKLKRILKEKLQAAALTTSMENLTLEESEKPTAEVEEDLHGVPVKLSEAFQESESSIDALQGEALSNDLVSDISENEATKPDVNATTLYPVEVLVDNEVIPEDAITVNIGVITCPAQSTPTKFSSIIKQPLLFTPPSKKPKSARKNNCVLDVNKENINDSAASKTEPGKATVAVTESGKLLSAMSMGKLKKEFKVLQQSEKKRQALQSRSENNCVLTSP